MNDPDEVGNKVSNERVSLEGTGDLDLCSTQKRSDTETEDDIQVVDVWISVPTVLELRVFGR